MNRNRSNRMKRRSVARSRLWRVLPAFAVLAIGVAPDAASPQDADASDLETLKSQVDELSRLAVRTQSHVMVDIEYHFTNLWFAAHDGQWDLAAFYLRETDSHLGWMVRMRPVRTLRGGGTVDLEPFKDSIEAAGFAGIGSAIEDHDVSEFEAAYRQTLPQCHACHQASGLGYLEPHVPEMPLSPLMLHPQ